MSQELFYLLDEYDAIAITITRSPRIANPLLHRGLRVGLAPKRLPTFLVDGAKTPQAFCRNLQRDKAHYTSR
jgi:hypothetical protein